MKTYKEMAAELDAFMQDLQSDNLDVDEAVKVYESASKLISQMEAYLQKTENKITKIKADLGGSA
jgi:exodeoxyribonuclease VII small subunit